MKLTELFCFLRFTLKEGNVVMTTEKTIPVFDPNKLEEYERITDKAVEIMNKLKDKIFIIEKYDTQEKYIEFCTVLMNTMLHGYEHREFRYQPVQYKFREEDKEEDVKWLPFQHFIINVIFWFPMMQMDKDNLDETFIIPSSKMNKMTPIFIKSYFDEKYTKNYNRHIPSMPNIKIEKINKQLNNITGEANYLFTRISSKFLKFFGLSSNIENFRALAERIPELNGIFYYTLDETMQPAEMEDVLDEMQNKAVNLIEGDAEFNPIKPLLQPKSGLNLKQFRDMVCVIGLKPDEDGRTIARPVNSNYLTGGLNSLSDYYTVAIPGRKAAIINYEFMGKTGHLLILISIATAAVKLSKTVADCGSVNPIPVEIKSEKHLQKLDGRRFKYLGEKIPLGGKYHIINSSKDKELIGQTVMLRSPITCCAKDGVCKECYGELYYTNIDNESPGIYSAINVMNPVVQGILSAKHHQTTNTTLIEFAPEFDQFFTISSTDIILNPEGIKDIASYSLVIRKDELGASDDDDNSDDEEQEDYATTKRKRKKKKKERARAENTDDIISGDDGEGVDDEEGEMELKLSYSVTKFEVVKNLNDKKKDPVYIHFEDAEKKDLFMHTDFIEKMYPGSDEYGDYLFIPLEEINPEDFIFLVDVYNNELTRPMKSIQKLLDNKQHEGCDNYEDIVNKMLELLIASKLSASSIHAEMIIRQLVRKSSNILKRPDFSRIITRKDYQLLTIGTALKQNPSVCTSIATPYLKDQLVSLTTTFEKTKTSLIDDLYRPTLVGEGR